jgi:hypothetical protein
VRRLSPPIYTAIDTYRSCVAEVADPALREKYRRNENHMIIAISDLSGSNSNASWSNLPSVPRGGGDRVIIGDLTKNELNYLYSAIMVDGRGVSRNIYDNIIVAAEGSCPFCGGIGQAKNLDHYLPKAHYPAYSVSPENLVPCCRDCNTGKGSSVAGQINLQTLHPYFDGDQFYDTRWVFARIFRTNPVTISFYCLPPDNWSDVDKQRVLQHFEAYQFARRFGIQAGAEISKVVDLRRESLSILSSNQFNDYLVDNANSRSYDVNGWNRTMYDALSRDEWFSRTDFRNQDWHLI